MRPLGHVRGSVSIQMLFPLQSSTAIGTDERPLRSVDGKMSFDGIAIAEDDMALGAPVQCASV